MKTPADLSALPGADLCGKTLWITGAAGYLGTPIVRTLDRIGARTICLDLPGKAEELIARHKLRHAAAESGDVCDPEHVGPLVERLTKSYGAPDGLVHLAFASSAGKRLVDLEQKDFQRTFEGGLNASFFLCRAVAEHMKAGCGGSIVLFSSMYGVVSPDPHIYLDEMKPNPIDYGMSKAGILQMMRYLAVHYGENGVRFNCVTPGAFPNPQVQAANPEFTALQKQKIPMRRPGKAEEIAGPTLFLLSDAASYITGHSLVVDGGWTIW